MNPPINPVASPGIGLKITWPAWSKMKTTGASPPNPMINSLRACLFSNNSLALARAAFNNDWEEA